MRRGVAAIAAIGIAIAAGAAEEEPAGGSAAALAAAKGASAEELLKQRLLARVRTLPGTDTEYLVAGYLQLDGIATRKGQEGEEQDTFFASGIPFGPETRDYRLSVRQSQLNWVSRTPAGEGHFWTRLEANLFPYDGTTSPTLNQLYARWDDYVVIGKTYSTFMDDSALPSTLDYNGPDGVTYVRYEGEGGHFQLAGLSRRTTLTVSTPLGTTDRGVDGSGVAASGSLSLFDDDSVLFQAASGKGIGRYFNDPLSAVGVSRDASGRLELLRMSGATLYYERKWSPEWATVAGASTLWVSDDARRPAESLRRTLYVSANLIRRLTPTLAAGAEVLWGEARRVDGASATNARVQLSLRVLVF
jgi:hypothetical protein